MYKKIVSKVIAGLILALTLAFIILPKVDFSERENRYLSRFPKFTWRTVKDGTFTEGLSDYVSDHFPFRDAWLAVNTNVSRAIGKKEVNGVLFAKDDYLIEKYESRGTFDSIARVINRFTEKTDTRVIFMAVPTSYEINKERLPKGIYRDKQKKDLENLYELLECETIDLSDALRKANESEPMFYRLDHHWTTMAARLGFEALMEHIDGKTENGTQTPELFLATDKFRGTIFNKVGECGLGFDAIYAADTSESRILYTNPEGSFETLYDDSKLETSDKYAYFLSGNFGIVTVENESVNTDRSLLLVKDSYANSMVPFLSQRFARITIIDPRFYDDKISDMAGEYDLILFLYNMNTMGNDTGIRSVK